jgi:hypothetical protein
LREQGGELSDVIVSRRLFPLIADNAQAREQVQIIAGWRPLPVTPPRVTQRRRGKHR